MTRVPIPVPRPALRCHGALIAACCAILPAATAQSAAPGSATPPGLSSSSWSGLRQAYDAARHRITRTASGHVAPNPGQRWSATFDERGFLVTPADGDWQWGLELVAYGALGAERSVEAPIGLAARDQRLERAWDAVLTEWYINDQRGLEHGYTVRERPAAWPTGELTLLLAVRGGLQPSVTHGGRGAMFRNDVGAVLTYTGLAVLDSDGRQLPAHFATAGDGLRLQVDDRAARYPIIIDPIVQQAYLKASNSDADDWFGSAVAVSGNTVVIGAPGEDSLARGVNGDSSDNSALESGAAYVFVQDALGEWSQQAYLKASNSDALDRFGYSVAASGDTIVVGAYLEDSNASGVDGNQHNNGMPDSGAAYVFVRNGSAWSQQAYLKAAHTSSRHFFGASVSISGNTIGVGAPRFSHTGTQDVYIYVRNGTVWSIQASIQASNADDNDAFGSAVALAGDMLIVGAPREASSATGINGDQHNNQMFNAGAVYIYVRNALTWLQQAYVKAHNTNNGDRFGWSVSVAPSGSLVVVGAPQDGSALPRAGAAYVFSRNGTTWSQLSYLTASNADSADSFGASVAVGRNGLQDIIVVGAPHEDSAASGLDGNQADNTLANSGAAYVFWRLGQGQWQQLSYVKASNPTSNARFGNLAVDGFRMVASAPWEDSDARCINGDQINNRAPNSGATYCFSNSNIFFPSLGLKLTNGANQHVDVARSPFTIPMTSITIEAWMTYDDDTLPAGPHRFPTIVRHTTTPGAESYWLRVEAGSTSARVLAFGVRSASGLSLVRYPFAPGQFKTWTHVAATCDGTLGTIFVNGAPVASNPIPGPIVDGGGWLRIGNGDTSLPGNETWHGMLDEVRIWPFARSRSEIGETMRDVISRVPNGVTFNFQSGSSGSYVDSSQGLSVSTVGPPPFVSAPAGRQDLPLGGTAFGTATTRCLESPMRVALGSTTRMGNLDFSVLCIEARPGTAGLMRLSALPLATPFRLLGIDLWLDPWSIFPIVLPALVATNGVARVPLPIPWCTHGAVVHSQFVFVDPQCGMSGLVSSPALTIKVQSCPVVYP